MILDTVRKQITWRESSYLSPTRRRLAQLHISNLDKIPAERWVTCIYSTKREQKVRVKVKIEVKDEAKAISRAIKVNWSKMRIILILGGISF